MATIKLDDIKLTPQMMRAVSLRAKKVGQSAAEFIRALIERDLLAKKSFDDMLRPIRRDVKASGVSPEDFDQIVNRAKSRYRAKPRRKA